jgi:hypothetical protein
MNDTARTWIDMEKQGQILEAVWESAIERFSTSLWARRGQVVCMILLEDS